MLTIIIPAALSWMLQVLTLAIVGVRAHVSPVYAFTAPLGLALMYAVLFDSAVSRIYDRSGVQPPRTSAG